MTHDDDSRPAASSDPPAKLAKKGHSGRVSIFHVSNRGGQKKTKTPSFLRLRRDIGVPTQEEYANRAVHLHDTFFGTRLGPFTIQIFPRKWASYLIIIGVICVIIGVAFILHVPQSHSGR